MRKAVGFALLLLGSSLYCLAGDALAVPEIDAAASAGAIALLAGGLLVLRARRKK